MIAVGNGKRLENGTLVPLDVKAYRILFGKYSGSDIKLDGYEYMITREDVVLGVRTRPPDGQGQLVHFNSKFQRKNIHGKTDHR